MGDSSSEFSLERSGSQQFGETGASLYRLDRRPQRPHRVNLPRSSSEYGQSSMTVSETSRAAGRRAVGGQERHGEPAPHSVRRAGPAAAAAAAATGRGTAAALTPVRPPGYPDEPPAPRLSQARRLRDVQFVEPDEEDAGALSCASDQQATVPSSALAQNHATLNGGEDQSSSYNVYSAFLRIGSIPTNEDPFAPMPNAVANPMYTVSRTDSFSAFPAPGAVNRVGSFSAAPPYSAMNHAGRIGGYAPLTTASQADASFRYAPMSVMNRYASVPNADRRFDAMSPAANAAGGLPLSTMHRSDSFCGSLSFGSFYGPVGVLAAEPTGPSNSTRSFLGFPAVSAMNRTGSFGGGAPYSALNRMGSFSVQPGFSALNRGNSFLSNPLAGGRVAPDPPWAPSTLRRQSSFLRARGESKRGYFGTSSAPAAQVRSSSEDLSPTPTAPQGMKRSVGAENVKPVSRTTGTALKKKEASRTADAGALETKAQPAADPRSPSGDRREESLVSYNDSALIAKSSGSDSSTSANFATRTFFEAGDRASSTPTFRDRIHPRDPKTRSEPPTGVSQSRSLTGQPGKSTSTPPGAVTTLASPRRTRVSSPIPSLQTKSVPPPRATPSRAANPRSSTMKAMSVPDQKTSGSVPPPRPPPPHTKPKKTRGSIFCCG